MNMNIFERGSLSGLFIGDALAMPVHWYYDRLALRRDYGWVTEFRRPRNPHPDSILFRSRYQPSGPKAEILHDQAQYWGLREVHYHQFLEAGENTLNLQLCRLALELFHADRYSSEAYLQAYIEFMTTPGRHRDTYIEECHRGFFTNYSSGRPPGKCAVQEKHVGGLSQLVVPFLMTRDADLALDHMAATHAGAKIRDAGRRFLSLLGGLLEGADPEAAGRDHLGGELARHLSRPDEEVIGRLLSPACYIEDALPAVFYLFTKYAGEPRKGLEANTNLGGDNCHRGALLGALLGAANGLDAWPQSWREGLKSQPNLTHQAAS